MQCKECGSEMWLMSTKGWYCKHCGISYDIQGNFLSREQKTKIPSKHNNVTIATIATIKIIKPITT